MKIVTSNVEEATLTVEVEPEYYLTGTIEVCENDSETYAAINTQNNMSFGCNWTISQNGTVVQTINAATDPVIDWNFGTGYFKLTAVPVVPDDYCTDVFEMNVNVVPTPPQVNAINGETNICPGTPYSYEADSGTLKIISGGRSTMVEPLQKDTVTRSPLPGVMPDLMS